RATLGPTRLHAWKFSERQRAGDGRYLTAHGARSLKQVLALALPQHADDHSFDHERLFAHVDADRLELFVLGQKPNNSAFLFIALDRHFVVQPGDDDLPISHLWRAVHGDDVAVQNADVLHTHAAHLQKVMRLGLEDFRVDLITRLDMLFREHGLAGRNSTNQRQAQLLTERILQLDASRGTWNQIDHALPL